MLPYWGVQRINTTQFARDRLKCAVDGNTNIVRLTLGEVEDYV